MLTVYLHIGGLDNTMVDIEELPKLTDTILVGKNPRRRDGKELDYMMQDVNTVIFPLTSIIFLEVLPTGEEDDFETFIRE